MAEERPTDQLSESDDSALFQEITAPGSTTPEAPTEQPPSPPPAASPPAAPEAMIPSARLREEADRARAAERRAEALQMQVEAMLQRFQPVHQQPPPQRADMFENPSGFVKEEVTPLIEPLNQQLMQVREFYSKRDALREFGPDAVNEAFAAIENGLRNRDPEANVTYQRIMRSLDPYGDMVRLHQQKVAFATVGGDLNAYNKRILDEAMRDPNFQAAVIAAARGGAPAAYSAPARGEQPRASNGQFASAPQSSLPSIARVGSTALTPDPQSEDGISDQQLFAETTSRGAKRPPK